MGALTRVCLTWPHLVWHATTSYDLRLGRTYYSTSMDSSDGHLKHGALRGKVEPPALRPHKVHDIAIVDTVCGQLTCALKPRGLENDPQIRGLDSHRSLPMQRFQRSAPPASCATCEHADKQPDA